MKIFISHSLKDKNMVEMLTLALLQTGHSVWVDSNNISMGDNIAEVISKALHEADVMIALITDNYLSSSLAQAELSAAIFGVNRTRTIPIIIGNIQIPPYLSGIVYLRLDDFTDASIKVIIEALAEKELQKDYIDPTKHKKVDRIEKNNEVIYLQNLKKALNENRLTLVCGAGISIDAGIPDWNELMIRALEFGLDKNNNPDVLSDFKRVFPLSNLILGKYLKILLGKDFEKIVSRCLYADEETLGEYAFQETRLLKAIIELIRPKRNKGSVESIITFNFDSLIEDLLTKNKIQYKSVFAEGLFYHTDEIPIFHVHGYLPRYGRLDNPNIVFSEDTYHTQFIDPFSWSNLIQLYKLMNNACLFVGLSLTDPNLRRLLDISKRKSIDDMRKHYIIKKLPSNNSKINEIQIMLEEQDANMLGLNIIWVNEYNDISKILEKINS
ncbi:TIR domain protein [Anaerotignum neopropionicum]|uniref:TIR domain protein n=1 Tax=Anaerotignum neopropionicum TaxID=36847 RepID=A0A136WGX4_9FIRM|nr:TIR domain-containing protein [Anaerotignum neopropionicum]KXL53775.1 TIR domain protein [Anaerotignum neopropionicum]